MGKNKLEKFADMASYPHVFEYPYSAVDNVPFEMKGNWHQQFFKNDNPIVLELDRGLTIKYVKFQLPQCGELQEPDVEIELDEYRSYNRSKRSSLQTGK